jgi:cell wall-associated NlpC family hydrolase
MSRNLLVLLFFLFSGCASYSPEIRTTREPVSQPQQAEALLQTLLALGIDYRPGGASPVTGFDCSGLVSHVYLEAWGIKLPRNTLAQSKSGTAVGLAELQAGDLVFYDTLNRPYSHVGIYLGDGRFVHAPKSGARVRVESVKSAYWAKRFNGARRIVSL